MGHVLIPPEVREELDRDRTPAPLRSWIAAPPSWLSVRPAPADPDLALAGLDPGERAVIALASTVGADAVLMDDRAGVAVARREAFALSARSVSCSAMRGAVCSISRSPSAG